MYCSNLSYLICSVRISYTNGLNVVNGTINSRCTNGAPLTPERCKYLHNFKVYEPYTLTLWKRYNVTFWIVYGVYTVRL